MEQVPIGKWEGPTLGVTGVLIVVYCFKGPVVMYLHFQEVRTLKSRGFATIINYIEFIFSFLGEIDKCF